MISKTIHYCWFGKNRKSTLINNCINSWKKLCPDFEIIEWNEENFDVNICPYVKEAYEQKKWAYVSDYARFYILNKYGGVYLDTDVELLKPLDDLLEKGAFAGFAKEDIINTGLIMACEKDDWLCKEVLKSYEGEHFKWDEDPSKILAVGRRVTSILVDNGLVCDGSLQHVNNYTIYPKYYFNPTDGDIRGKVDPRAYSIHHYAATWFPRKARIKNTIRRFIGKKNIDMYHSIRNKILGK